MDGGGGSPGSIPSNLTPPGVYWACPGSHSALTPPSPGNPKVQVPALPS